MIIVGVYLTHCQQRWSDSWQNSTAWISSLLLTAVLTMKSFILNDSRVHLVVEFPHFNGDIWIKGYQVNGCSAVPPRRMPSTPVSPPLFIFSRLILHRLLMSY